MYISMLLSVAATETVNDGRDGDSSTEDHATPAGAAGGQYGTGETMQWAHLV